jgi:hypothetical protein
VVKFCCILAFALSLTANADDITPRVGDIEVYGLHKLSREKIIARIGVKPGDPFPMHQAAEEKISAISGIVGSHVEAICCEDRRMILYVGIEERNAPHAEFHAAPTGSASLAPEIVTKYEALLDVIAVSMRNGHADEDLTNGYSLMVDPDCRDLQQALIPLAAENLNTIDQVLRTSSDPEQRAIAAYVLQYGPRSARSNKIIADGLQYALQDPDEDVRKSALTALKAVMVGARLHPDQQIHIEPTWFVELMNSTVWEDRRSATLALLGLTDRREPETLALIRERALPSVLEMARWKHLEHALPAFILAGRLAGMDEEAIHQAWVNGEREAVLEKALNPSAKHHR